MLPTVITSLVWLRVTNSILRVEMIVVFGEVCTRLVAIDLLQHLFGLLTDFDFVRICAPKGPKIPKVDPIIFLVLRTVRFVANSIVISLANTHSLPMEQLMMVLLNGFTRSGRLLFVILIVILRTAINRTLFVTQNSL